MCVLRYKKIGVSNTDNLLDNLINDKHVLRGNRLNIFLLLRSLPDTNINVLSEFCFEPYIS